MALPLAEALQVLVTLAPPGSVVLTAQPLVPTEPAVTRTVATKPPFQALSDTDAEQPAPGAGVEGAGVDGAGVDGAGVDGAGVDGAGVDGLGGVVWNCAKNFQISPLVQVVIPLSE